MRDYLYFDSMITPKIITFFYWLLLIVVLIGGLTAMFQGTAGVIGGLIVWLVGSIMVRVWCELMIVLFKINENMQKLADRSSGA